MGTLGALARLSPGRQPHQAAAAAAAAAGAAAEAGDDVPSVLRIDDGSGTALAIPDEVIEELPQMSVAGDAASTLAGQRAAINSFGRFLKKGVAKQVSERRQVREPPLEPALLLNDFPRVRVLPLERRRPFDGRGAGRLRRHSA